MEEEIFSCPVCGAEEAPRLEDGDKTRITCVRCGIYHIDNKVLGELDVRRFNKNGRQRINLSYWLRSNPGSPLTSSNIEGLLDLPTAPLHQRADALLLYLAKKHPIPGTNIKLIDHSTEQSKPNDISNTGDGKPCFVEIPEMEGVSGSEDRDELNFI